jgi:hypothetical protein
LVEFDMVFHPGGNQKPKIKCISENETWVKSCLWSQPVVFPHHSGVSTIIWSVQSNPNFILQRFQLSFWRSLLISLLVA